MESMGEIILTLRDEKIIREVDRWRICQGKHIKELVSFCGQRACDRRLQKLINAGYIKREKILYGVAGIYSNTNKGNKKIMTERRNRKIRVEQIVHDIAVIDTAIFFKKEHGINLDGAKTEIELHRQDGFGVRKHRPDFVFEKDGKKVCVEVELSLKSKHRFEKNIKDNFLNYDKQIWVVPSMGSKISKILEEKKKAYSNIEILELSEVQKLGGENN